MVDSIILSENNIFLNKKAEYFVNELTDYNI